MGCKRKKTRRRLAAVLGALLLASSAFLALAQQGQAEPAYTTVSATQTVSTVTFVQNTRTVLIINDGANEAYFRIFHDMETAGAATTSSPEIKSGEALEFTYDPSSTDQTGGPAGYYKTLSIICATGETATVRVISK